MRDDEQPGTPLSRVRAGWWDIMIVAAPPSLTPDGGEKTAMVHIQMQSGWGLIPPPITMSVQTAEGLRDALNAWHAQRDAVREAGDEHE